MKPNFGEKSVEKSTTNREAGNAQFYSGNYRQVTDCQNCFQHFFTNEKQLWLLGVFGPKDLTKFLELKIWQELEFVHLRLIQLFSKPSLCKNRLLLDLFLISL